MVSYFYLHGFASSPQGNKSQFFKEKITALGYDYYMPDLNQPDFENITLTAQIKETVRQVNKVGGKVHLIGSSMGALVALLSLDQIRDKVSKMMLLAPALDILSPQDKFFTPEIVSGWKKRGYLELPHYSYNKVMKVKYTLVEDAQQYRPYEVDITCPVFIIHGEQDEVIDYQNSLEFARSRVNVRIEIIKGDHQLNGCLDKLWDFATEFFNL